MISPSQRPLPDNTQHSQQTNIHAPGRIRTHDRSRRAAVGLRLRSRGYWDRQLHFIMAYLMLLPAAQSKNAGRLDISWVISWKTCVRKRLWRCLSSFLRLYLFLSTHSMCTGYFYTWSQWITHTHTHSLGRTPLDELSAHCRDFYLITHNTHKKLISMGFEPAILASERPQTHTLDRSTTRHYLSIYLTCPWKTIQKSVQTAGLPAEIRTGHLSDTSHNGCRLILSTRALGVTQNILQIGLSTTGIRSKWRRA
jgi:hypothetical protein